MAAESRTLLRKAEMVVSDFTSAGVLQPAQAAKFIQLAIKEPVLLQDITVTTMTALKEERDTMRFAGRVLKAGTEATPLVAGDWAKPTLGMFELDAQLFRVEARMSEEVLEDQIERGQLQNTIMDQLSAAIGRDMEWVGVNGDTTSADPALAKLDGILKQIASNTVDAADAKLSKTILRDMLRTMPDEFRRGNLMYHTNGDAVIDYGDALADRGTQLGDIMITSDGKTVYRGKPVKEVPEFPVSVGTNRTFCLLGDPAIIHLGVYRKVRIKVGEDISAGTIIITGTVRFDVKVGVETMYVKAYSVKGA